jgi:nucleotide-binding universal stress UspA family protein
MKFLIPTDFSENAFHAAAYALTLAKQKSGSSIHLVHVITPVVMDPLLVQDIEKEATISIEKVMTELKDRCSGCHLSHVIRRGETSTEITNAAEEWNTGIIVMGIRGLGKKSRFMFGSNTISLINKSSRPVLVVPEASVFRSPQRIVFGTDYYDSDLDALHQLLPIARAFNSEIIITHIFEDSDEEQSEQAMMNFISDEIFKKVQYPRIGYQIYKSRNVALGIKHFCEFMEADLLVLSARKRNVFEKLFQNSVTKDASYNSDIPLLIFHVHKTGG